MTAKSEFQSECEALFAIKLGYGRRWKSSAAQALGIGRATLYRYFEPGHAVPEDILRRLETLSGGNASTKTTHQMVSLFARGLLDLQVEVDAHGWIKTGYPASLQRTFDLASAQNALGGHERWPTDLAALTRMAQQPLYEWGIDLSWDPEGDYTDAALIIDGAISPECADLAAPGHDPETELTENVGFRLLLDACHSRPDGQDIYTAFRRCVISQPFVSGWSTLLTSNSIFTTIDGFDEIASAFYQSVPESLAIGRDIPVCRVSGTILRKGRGGFHTECRDPEAIRLARDSSYNAVKWRRGALQLRRAFRLYWCLPGIAELALADALAKAGWHCELWPDFDQVDVSATSPDGGQNIAVDVKDYLSPMALAARFAGFKSYGETMTASSSFLTICPRSCRIMSAGSMPLATRAETSGSP